MDDDLNEDNKFMENSEKDEADSEQLGNPAPPPDVDMDLLRGDRIGDTVYSGKWCIKTVMKLMQSNVVAKSEEGEDKAVLVDMDEDLQNEVGVLWDMTINVEVCQYLQSVGAIESIYHVIANSRCPRASEMCVGMLANIVSHEELWQALHSDETLFAIIIPLLGHTDQPLLLEVSRFFNTALNHQENRTCYDSMWDNRDIVCQELLRILSGSTNSDLLRQTSELTHILMSLDQTDSRFNTLFADADFITAVLEASKEFGYKHESSGQVRVMDILHCFTTYEAGISAMEPCMEQMTIAAVNYLKMLCSSLNLSSSCDVITVIVRILNHIFCRSLAVRIELMSSSSLMQCFLKTLVSLYRKLRLYDSIAIAAGSKTMKDDMKMSEDLSSKLAAVPSPSWENMSAEDEKKSRRPEASWSERAGIGEASSQTYRTPDASPQQPRQLKELDLSWSERRGASPLEKIPSEELDNKWKRPAERKKKLKRRTETKDARDVEKVDKEEEEEEGKTSRDEGNDKVSASGDRGESSKDIEEGGDRNDSSVDERLSSHSLSPGQESHVCSNVDRRISCTDSTTSVGFEPSQDTSDGLGYLGEDMDFDDTKNAGASDKDKGLERDGQTKDPKMQNSVKNSECDSDSHHKSENDTRPAQSEQHENSLLNNDDEDSKDFCPASTDKYQALLNVLSEFLTDFFNNIRENLMTEDDSPVLAEIVVFLDNQCSSVHIRALVKCLSPDGSTSKPLSRLLHLTKHLKADHLQKVIVDFLPDAGTDAIV